MLYFSDPVALKLYKKLADDHDRIGREIMPYNKTVVTDINIARKYGHLEGLREAIDLIKLLYAEDK